MPGTALKLLSAVLAICALGGDWRHFRGTDNRSVSSETGLPLTFGHGSNVTWKAPLPGRGPSSPIVVGDRVVVTCSSGPREDRLHVLCFDAGSGKRLWERQLWATGHTLVDRFAANAAPTPASDGRLIFALFSSNDLACFDLEGNLKWFRGLAYDNPTIRNDVGMASSPLVVDGTLIVQLDTPGDSLVTGLDTASGRARWQLDREKGAIWASPTLLRGETPEDDLVLLQSRSRLTAHRPHTGQLVWQYEARCHTIASVATCGDRVYLPSHGLHALRYDRASGRVKLLWYQPRLSSNNASPIVHDGRVYTFKPSGILACGDAADGRVLWQLRLKGPLWSTPVLAEGRLYCVNHGGLVQVVQLGPKGRIIGRSQIDPAILASPAVANGAIYFRSDRHLWRIAAE